MLNSGVTQRSILGPLSFLICTNDFPEVTEYSIPDAEFFAIFSTGRTIDIILSKLISNLVN